MHYRRFVATIEYDAGRGVWRGSASFGAGKQLFFSAGAWSNLDHAFREAVDRYYREERHVRQSHLGKLPLRGRRLPQMEY